MSFAAAFEAVSPVIRDVCGGDVARLAPTADGEFTDVSGKFDNNFLLVMADVNGGMESRGPVFEYLTSDYPTLDHGYVCDVDSKRYAVVGIQPNQNFTRLILELAP